MLEMRARITNYSYRNVFPTCLGNLFIPRGKEIELNDAQAIKELKNFPQVEIKVLEKEAMVDYSVYSINELRSIAARAGIKGSFFKSKKELIKLLEEKDGISTC